MARSRKMKSSIRKVRKSRRGRGSGNELTWELDEGDRVFPDGKYKGHRIFWTEEPINVPEKKRSSNIYRRILFRLQGTSYNARSR